MGRQLHKLNALQVGRLLKSGTKGRHGDGGGLYLSIDAGDRKRWVFLFRDRRSGKLREMGLGSAVEVTLAMAREKAQAARDLLRQGADPIAASRAAVVPIATVPTFTAMAEEVIASLETAWRNEKHRAQWRSTLTTYCKAIGTKPVDEIATADVLAVLQPIWKTKPETASRIRGRIERVLDAAKAKGHRTGENPARWRGHLDTLLPPRTKLSRGHFSSLPWTEVPEFMSRLRQRDGVGCLALEFAILTAARSQEVREARWEEFDLDKRVWTIPPLDQETRKSRMKAGREHRVPLTARAVEIIETMAKLPREAYVFPGQRKNRPLSDMTLSAVLRRMNVPSTQATQHGFRASFKTWGYEATTFARELIEASLSHVTGDKVERAYLRGDALERRRELMSAWAQFLNTDRASNVVVFSQARAG